MTTSEIHVNLSILLQKINTHKSKNFLPQELDLLFNFMLYTYKNKNVDLASNPKQLSLFDTQTTLDKLSDLIETETLYPISINQEEAEILLPLDFFGWISSEAKLAYDCTTAYDADNPTPILHSKTIIKGLDNINLTDLTSFVLSLTYIDKQEEEQTVTLFDFTSLPPDYIIQAGAKDYQRSFIFINALVAIIKKTLLQVNEDSIEKIYCTYNNKYNRIELSTDSVIHLTLSTNISNIIIDEEITTINLPTLLKPIKAPVSIIDSEYNALINSSSLSNSSVNILYANRTRQSVKVKIPKNVKFHSLSLIYLRFPRKIDYLLNINTDLPDDMINKVLADTAQFIKGLIASDSYEKFIRENTLID